MGMIYKFYRVFQAYIYKLYRFFQPEIYKFYWVFQILKYKFCRNLTKYQMPKIQTVGGLFDQNPTYNGIVYIRSDYIIWNPLSIHCPMDLIP